MAEIRTRPSAMRSRLMLEIVSELLNRPDFPGLQASVALREQGSNETSFEFFGGSGWQELERVANGELTVGIINPSALLTVASLGVSPFRQPLPLRPIAVIPSLDQLVLAVRADLGITKVEELVDLRTPLRVSLRGQRFHSVHVVVDHVLEVAGLSLGDIRARGGAISYDEGLPRVEQRIGGMRSGQHNAIFDEGAHGWVDLALEADMRILTMTDATIERLVSWGYRRTTLARDLYPSMDYDVTTVDFSGFAVYVHADLDDSLVTKICESLDARKAALHVSPNQPLRIDEAISDSTAAPMGVPLHDAARVCWEKLGYL